MLFTILYSTHVSLLTTQRIPLCHTVRDKVVLWRSVQHLNRGNFLGFLKLYSCVIGFRRRLFSLLLSQKYKSRADTDVLFVLEGFLVCFIKSSTYERCGIVQSLKLFFRCVRIKRITLMVKRNAKLRMRSGALDERISRRW